MSLSYKARALRRLEALRTGNAIYEPRSSASDSSAFRDSPILYYTVYDGNLAPVRKNVVYAHSLEELQFMAIDNASRLETFDQLFRLRPDFSARNMTLRDLILTAFVGTKDGQLSSMLICPYQGDTPFDLGTTLYATVMSDLVRNTRQTPLRIALNVPAGMQKWSHMSKLRMFGRSSDKQLIELNSRVNCFQIVELRNDPDGTVRYSQKALDAMKAKNAPAEKVAPASAEPLSNGAESGTAMAASTTEDLPGTSEEGEMVVEYPVEGTGSVFETTDPTTGLDATEANGASGHVGEATAELQTDDAQRAPIALATEEPEGSEVDVSAISGPLKAARLEDNIAPASDSLAVEANQSHPAFEGLERDQRAGEVAEHSTRVHEEEGLGATSATKDTGVEAEEEDEFVMAPSLNRGHSFQ